MLGKTECLKASQFLNQSMTQLAGGTDGFHIHYWGATTEHYDNPVHRHSFYEVCYVLSGQGRYRETDGADFELHPGDLFCSRPGVEHQILSDSGMELFFVAFHSLDDSAIPIPENKIHAASAGDTLTAQLWRLLYQTVSQDTGYSQAVVSHLALSLLLSFSDLFSHPPDQGEPPALHRQTSHLARQAILYVEDNLASPLGLDRMAEHLHISRRHVSRLFSEETGQSFALYVQERRVQKALSLLQTTDWEVRQISAACGFHSVHYFTRVFSGKMGISPAAFRKHQFTESLHPKHNLSQ